MNIIVCYLSGLFASPNTLQMDPLSECMRKKAENEKRKQ